MWLPVIRGVIERRLLINYRADPETLSRLLPRPFEPLVVRGYGLAGICLIRLGHVRPSGMPWWSGFRSENAAHRVAVIWNDNGRRCTGVYIWRRDTDSRLNNAAGGRIFPGVHHLSRFDIHEGNGHYEVNVHSAQDEALLHVQAQRADVWPDDSVLGSLDEASAFFEAGSVGYSPGPMSGQFQGLALQCRSWKLEPLTITSVHSSAFENHTWFPRGSVQLDSALVMREVEHEWHALGPILDCGPAATEPTSHTARADESAGDQVQRSQSPR